MTFQSSNEVAIAGDRIKCPGHRRVGLALLSDTVLNVRRRGMCELVVSGAPCHSGQQAGQKYLRQSTARQKYRPGLVKQLSHRESSR